VYKNLLYQILQNKRSFVDRLQFATENQRHKYEIFVMVWIGSFFTRATLC